MVSTRTASRSIPALFAGAALLLAAAGCNSKTSATPENFTAGLNAHFEDHLECLLPDARPFPLETSDPTQLKQLNALVASQMLDVEVEPSIHVSRFTPTQAGARLAPKFCYGHRVVTSIDSFTPPAVANGFNETKVTYHYRIDGVPVWANSDGIRTAFPAFAKATSGSATDTATMASTIAGWQVPD